MPKTKVQLQPSSSSSSSRVDRSFCIKVALVILLVCALWSFTEPWPRFSAFFSNNDTLNFQSFNHINHNHDSQEKTFYDDPDITYTLDKPVKNWDQKRKEWLKLHPSFVSGVESGSSILLLTGSQPSPCKNPIGDHLLLRAFKNKADYCRIHGYDIFYSNACLHPKLCNVWAKLALIRSAMVAHPEAEWLWWMDSDAIFTDMDFKIPLERYKEHNLVVHGWPDMIYEKKSWVALNTGSFLVRNCQWSMYLLDVWASMSPHGPDYKGWGKTLRTTLSDKLFPDSDEQSSLVYLLLKEKKKWGEKIYVENEYSLHGYWIAQVVKFDNLSRKYEGIEKAEPELRRRHAEVVSESYAKRWEEYLVKTNGGNGYWRRPFVTHFTGCQPCSGSHSPEYKGNMCWVEMERALNFADNQVLRNYGFVHPDLGSVSRVSPLGFDYPLEDSEELV